MVSVNSQFSQCVQSRVVATDFMTVFVKMVEIVLITNNVTSDEQFSWNMQVISMFIGEQKLGQQLPLHVYEGK